MRSSALASLAILAFLATSPGIGAAPNVPLFPLAHAAGVIEQDDVHWHGRETPGQLVFREFGLDLCGGDDSPTAYWMRATIVGAMPGDVVWFNTYPLTSEEPTADFRTISGTDSCPPSLRVHGERVSAAIVYDAFAYCYGVEDVRAPCVLDNT